MQHILASISALAFLSTAHAALCPYTFANFTTCAIRNGLTAAGSATSMKQLTTDEYVIKRDYDADTQIIKTGDKAAECLRRYNDFHCIEQSSFFAIFESHYAAPCNAAGFPVRPCYAWCVDFRKSCYKYEGDQWTIDSAIDWDCQTTYIAKKDNPVCYGDAGISGMKSAAPALAASAFLAPLALFAAFSFGIS